MPRHELTSKDSRCLIPPNTTPFDLLKPQAQDFHHHQRGEVMSNEIDQIQSPNDCRLIQVHEVRKRLGGVSAMWLHRHQNDLPQSIKIGGRRFWFEAEIASYISSLSAFRDSVHE